MEENNMILGEIKVRDGKAFILLNPAEEKKLEEETSTIRIQKTEDEISDTEGAIVEINIKQKEVVKINSIKSEDIVPLAEDEKASAQEIVEAEEILKELIPKEAKIEKINPSFPKNIKLTEEDDEVEVVPQAAAQKKAKVHYTLDGKKWVIEVNLTEKKVEKVQYSSDNKESKGRE